MANRANGTLDTGVTSILARRVWDHREGVLDGFTKQYGLTRVVFVERHETMLLALAREKTVKGWPLGWKVRPILDTNPGWVDVWQTIAHG